MRGCWLGALLAVVVLAGCTGAPSVSSARLASGRPGAVQSGAVQSGAVQSGAVQSGDGRSRDGRSGDGRSGDGRTGKTRSAAVRPQPLTAAAKACGPMPAFASGTADELMAGRLTISPWPAVTIDPHHDGDVDWSIDPFGDPTWFQTYQSGSWIEALIERYLRGGPDAEAYAARARALLLGWMHDVPIQARDPRTLICSSEAFPGQSWIQDQIPALVNYQLATWQGAWNHGLKQDLEILDIGCAYPAGAFGGQALTWRQEARQQMLASFAPNRLGPAVDAQGATNEQAIGYARFTYYLWTQAEQQLAACGYSLPAPITSRIALMPAFLAEATQPDGNLVQIGDTYVETPGPTPGVALQDTGTRGTAAAPPLPRVAVYTAGYVFGRSTWRPFGTASFYSLRFGPGRQVHGHDDHMSLTYYARGRNLLVNAGHTGYEDTAYRAYLQSPEASNVLIMPGVPFSGAAPTDLIRQVIGADGQFFEFTDTAFGGNPRDRSVYISQRPDLVLVFDRASGATSYEQLWHLDPGLTVTRVSRSAALATAPGTQLEISQIPLPGQLIPRGSTGVIRGQTGPYQGWVSHQMLQRIPAPVITMTRTGPSTAILTLIAPSGPGAAVSTAITRQPGGWYHLQVNLGGDPASFLISAGGYIEQSRAGPVPTDRAGLAGRALRP
jgi:Heparinase II/III-like protein